MEVDLLTPAPEGAVQTPTDGALPTDGEKTGIDTGKGSDEPEKSLEIIQLEKNLGRTINALKNLQAENAKLKEAGKDAGKAGDPSKDGKGDEHPALKGLGEPDEEGLIYDPKTKMRVTPEYLVDRYETNQKLEELAGKREKDDLNRCEAQVDQARNAVLEHVAGHLLSKREEMFPDLKDEQARRVDRVMFTIFDEMIAEKLDGKKLEEAEPSLILDTAKDTMKELSQVFGVFGAKQIQSNQDYLKRFPLKPDGQPGVHPPKPLHQMTRKEREQAGEYAARMAEQMLES
jgi:hypothetical protein